MRGKHKDLKQPARRMVTASLLSFEILSSLGYDYSEVFEEGRKAIFRKWLSNRIPPHVGMFKISRLDMLIQDLEEEIDALQGVKTLLEETREAQSKLMTLPEGLREQQIVFGELAAKHLTQEEIQGYHKAFIGRIRRGESGFAVAKSLLSDVAARANGSGVIIKEIQAEMAPLYRENLVWNFLTEAMKE